MLVRIEDDWYDGEDMKIPADFFEPFEYLEGEDFQKACMLQLEALINQSDYKYKYIFTDNVEKVKVNKDVANAAEAAVQAHKKSHKEYWKKKKEEKEKEM